VAKTTFSFNSGHTVRQYAHSLLLESPFVPSSTNCWAVLAPKDSFWLRCTVSPQYKTSQTTDRQAIWARCITYSGKNSSLGRCYN